MNFLEALQTVYFVRAISKDLLEVCGARKNVYINSSLHVVFVAASFPLYGNTDTMLKTIKALAD